MMMPLTEFTFFEPLDYKESFTCQLCGKQVKTGWILVHYMTPEQCPQAPPIRSMPPECGCGYRAMTIMELAAHLRDHAKQCALICGITHTV